MEQANLRTGFMLLALFLSIGLSVYFGPKLPNYVPVHFNARGEVDRYSKKLPMLFMSPTSIAFISAMFAISYKTVKNQRYWHKKIRRPVPVEELENLIRLSIRLIDFTFICATILFLDLQIETFLVALHRLQKLSYITWIVSALMLLSGFYYTFLLIKEQRKVQRRPREISSIDYGS